MLVSAELTHHDLYYCLFAPRTYGVVLRAYFVRGELRSQRTPTERLQQRQRKIKSKCT